MQMKAPVPRRVKVRMHGRGAHASGRFARLTGDDDDDLATPSPRASREHVLTRTDDVDVQTEAEMVAHKSARGSPSGGVDRVLQMD